MSSSQSVSEQLKHYAKNQKNYIDLTRLEKMYLSECLFRRIAQSTHCESLVLKGAMAFTLYVPNEQRTTNDTDFLVLAYWTESDVNRVFREILSVEVADGAIFDGSTITVSDAGREREYPGFDITFEATIDSRSHRLNVDLCFGEVVTPKPKRMKVTRLLNAPAAKLLIYPIATIFAEKLETILRRGMANSRLRDYADLFWMCSDLTLDGEVLVCATQATCEKRKTTIPERLPLGLSKDFAQDKGKRDNWTAFLKSQSGVSKVKLDEAIELIVRVAQPVLAKVRGDITNELGTWKDREWK